MPVKYLKPGVTFLGGNFKDFLFDYPNPDTTNIFVAAGTNGASAGATGGGIANHVLAVSIAGTTHYIPVFNGNT